MKVLQDSDQSLAKIRNWIEEGKAVNPRKGCNETYFRDEKTGLIFRTYVTSKQKGSLTFKQLVLPEKLRDNVLQVAHDSILGGHLGNTKTLDRVLNNFFWPGITQDVQRYCQSCDICQRTFPKGRGGKAPLGQMPIIHTPFSRVAVDLVGPLPLSNKGNRFILVLVDCATRYPEAVALKNIETTTVAEELVNIFCRVGIPNEILSDRGTQFTSDLMNEVARLLSLRQLFTTPYHAMCNGLVERFNGTLKKMLSRMSAEKPKDWDRYISPLLFAYREVPQASLGFSPFEMLYGRTVRGPLSILKDLWTGEKNSEEEMTTYQHVFQLREKLEETCRLAHEELRSDQQMQKKYFDRKARLKKLLVGDKVLILLPTDNNKLLMQWKGPFNIIKKVRENDYVLDMNGREKTFHANMLKKYLERMPVTVGSVCAIGSLNLEIATSGITEESDYFKSEIAHCPLDAKESFEDVLISKDLTTEQQMQLQQLTEEFQDVLTDLPGETDLIECSINLVDDIPFRVNPYPVPFALKKEMNDEVDKMLRMKVIEPSESQYASSPVIVRKSDGSCRYCIDFRKLNCKAVFDAEPVPNQEILINNLGKAKYISQIDLSKGFWQIPVKDSDRHFLAFKTDRGLMQFRKLPFGYVNAIAVFCRMVRKMLQDIQDTDAYVDNIAIYAEEWEPHLI